MHDPAVIYVGAEAEIRLSTFMDMQAVQKKRIPKSYRIKAIDSVLIAARTKEESKLMMESRQYGVAVPIIYDVDREHGIITMEYLAGDRVKDIFNQLDDHERNHLCQKIGQSIARLHNHDIIHGDITTSNMIVMDERIHFIDFGLGGKDSEIEAKGVDLHVLMEAFESTHSRYAHCFDAVRAGYQQEFNGDATLVFNKIDEIVRRGRYRK